MTDDILSDYIFPSDVERRLKMMVENPSMLPKFSVFYGEPGTGKTTFANRYAERVSHHVTYVPTNEDNLPNDKWEKIESALRSSPLIFDEDDTKHFSRLFIIDEFHNLSLNKQDKFKTIHDRLDDDVRFIFILNTDGRGGVRKGRLHHRMSPAMLSRCFPFSFDVSDKDIPELLPRYRQMYPHLSDARLVGYLPDHRRLHQENLMRSFG